MGVVVRREAYDGEMRRVVYLGSGISRGPSEFGSPRRWAPTYA